MRQVVSSPVAIPGPAEVTGIHSVPLKVPYRIWTHQEAVLVELERGGVVVVVETDLRRVAREKEVLAVVVGEEQVLAAVIERVKCRVRVFLPLTKIDEVELIAVRESRAEEPDTAVNVGEQEPAEVADKWLSAGLAEDEVIIRTEVGKF